jgi:FkbM family methyltransferase
MTTFSLSDYRLHNTGRLDGNGPVLISTPPQRWAYAVEFPAQQDAGPIPAALIVAVDLTVHRGVVRIGCVGADQAFLVEREWCEEDGDTQLELAIPPGAACCALIVRNASPGSIASRVEIRSITTHEATGDARSRWPEVALDPAIWAAFTPWSGLAPAGYVMDWLGVRTRVEYREVWSAAAMYRQDRWESPRLVTDRASVLDWAALLVAARQAGETFVVAELGAGWGPWLTDAAAVARQTRRDYRVIGVEAEPTHFRWMRRHLLDNAIDPGRCRLIEAAVGARTGACWFGVGRPTEWYGQSIATDVDASDDAPLGTFAEARDGTTLRRTRVVGLDEVLAGVDRVDYMHLDIQGSELDVLAASSELLQERVGMITVATHSELMERGLRRLFASLEWTARYDVPIDGTALVRVGDEAPVEVRFHDGVQMWVNPAFDLSLARHARGGFH